MDPQQELFSYLLIELKKAHPDMVYDGFLPSENTSYPFIYLADSQLVDDFGNKTVVLGRVYQTINVWHDNPEQRGTMSSLLSSIKTIARNLTETSHYKWSIKNIDQRILPDTSTGQTLMNGIIELEYEITGGKTK